MAMLNRRTFVLGGLATAGALALSPQGARAAAPYPFKLGMASGEPASTSFVLWTRLAPSPIAADGQGGDRKLRQRPEDGLRLMRVL